MMEFRSSSEVAEMTWENRRLTMHELDRMVPSPVQVGTGETLECIVDQATLGMPNQNEAIFSSLAAPWGGKWPKSSSGDMQMKRKEASLSSMAAASGGKLSKSSGNMDTSSCFHARPADLANKRTRSESEQNCGRYFEEGQRGEASKCASASFCRDTDTTMMTWASFEPPQSFKSTRNVDEDSGFHTCSGRNFFSFVG